MPKKTRSQWCPQLLRECGGHPRRRGGRRRRPGRTVLPGRARTRVAAPLVQPRDGEEIEEGVIPLPDLLR
jgi:hypothetical protein